MMSKIVPSMARPWRSSVLTNLRITKKEVPDPAYPRSRPIRIPRPRPNNPSPSTEPVATSSTAEPGSPSGDN
jgi:hypothetical protein